MKYNLELNMVKKFDTLVSNSRYFGGIPDTKNPNKNSIPIPPKPNLKKKKGKEVKNMF